MDSGLLTTKIRLPPLRRALVRRPRLTSGLAAGLLKPVTLIAAPAGFGKTTLAVEALTVFGPGAGSEGRAAWLSLDEDDNDPTRFFSYLSAALQVANPHLGEAAAALLSQPEGLQAIVSALINEISALQSPLILVLDDYHLIAAEPIHTALTYLIEHCPPALRLILTARADPPLPLARWRTRDQLTEIRAAELRFTPAEAADFLNRVMALSLSSADVQRLEERTEGWVGGLQLAALAARAQADPGSVVDSFTGSHTHLVEYFGEEVLRQQTDELQIFLLQTSILERFNADLCAAVTGRDDSLRLLQTAYASHLFISPLDDAHTWYRYHALFADFLRQRLRRGSTEHRRELHRRASRWYEAHGLSLEAIDQALAAADFDRAARLIDAAAPGWLRRGESATLFDKLAALPDAVTRADSQLCLWKAWALVLAGQEAAVEPWLRLAERYFLGYKQRADSEPHYRKSLLWNYRTGYGQALAIRATLAMTQGDESAAIELAQRALDLLPRNDLTLPGLMALTLGRGYLTQGRLTPACEALAQAVKDSRAAGHAYIQIEALTIQAQTYVLLGDLNRARKTYTQAIRVAGEYHLSQLGQAAAQGLAGLSEQPGPADISLVEALNPRELEILRFIATGLSNQAIAEKLVIAVSTVRWHVKHLYRKLGVHNRTQAAHQARLLDLL